MIDRPIVISLYDPRPDGRPTHETGRVSARFETTVSELIASLANDLGQPKLGALTAYTPFLLKTCT